MWKLEEGPLIPLEVDSERKRQGGDRLKIPGVQEFNPNIHVTIGFRPIAILEVDQMPLILGGVQRKNLLHHSANTCFTSWGQRTGSNPCLRNSASAMRSRPKP